MTNDDFKKYATSYSGFVGGNPNAKYIFCGIDNGGSLQKDISQPIADFPCYKTLEEAIEDSIHNPFLQRLQIVMGAIEGIASFKDKAPKDKVQALWDKNAFFSKTSNYCLLNLYPLNCQGSSSWLKEHSDISGFEIKKQYEAWCLENRKNMFQDLISRQAGRVVICFGCTFKKDFIYSFIKDGAKRAELMFGDQGKDKDNMIEAYQIEQDNIDYLIIVPHLTAPNRNSKMENWIKLGEHIKKP